MTIKLGNRLASIRKEKGYSQEELAEKLGVSRQAISKWECGEASPDTDNLIELAKIYNMSLDELLEIKKEEPVKSEDEEKEIIKKDIEEVSEIATKRAEHKIKTSLVDILISTISTVSIVVAYILLGTLLGLWGKAWILFLLVPIIPSIVEMIKYRNMNKFCYPVLVTFVYLLVCLWLDRNDLWHPLWVMFLSIPVYYIIGDAINKALHIKDEDDDDDDDDEDDKE